MPSFLSDLQIYCILLGEIKELDRVNRFNVKGKSLLLSADSHFRG
jgi:hypothetical protein